MTTKAKPGESLQQGDWTTVKVPTKVAARARALRVKLLKGGQKCLPPALRSAILIPENLDPKLIDRKFGLGQIFELALSALENGVRDPKK